MLGFNTEKNLYVLLSHHCQLLGCCIICTCILASRTTDILEVNLNRASPSSFLSHINITIPIQTMLNMFCQTLILAAAMPLVSAVAMYAASLPLHVRDSVDSGSCILPGDYQIENLGGLSSNGSYFSTLDFTFKDDTTLLDTQCHLNGSSVPIEYPGRAPRFPCDNPHVQFIFSTDRIAMIESLCPGDDGYVVPLVCLSPV